MTPRTPLLLSSGIKIERSLLEVEIHFVQFEWLPTFVSQSGVQILIMEFVAANSGDSEDFFHDTAIDLPKRKISYAYGCQIERYNPKDRCDRIHALVKRFYTLRLSVTSVLPF